MTDKKYRAPMPQIVIYPPWITKNEVNMLAAVCVSAAALVVAFPPLTIKVASIYMLVTGAHLYNRYSNTSKMAAFQNIPYYQERQR